MIKKIKSFLKGFINKHTEVDMKPVIEDEIKTMQSLPAGSEEREREANNVRNLVNSQSEQKKAKAHKWEKIAAFATIAGAIGGLIVSNKRANNQMAIAKRILDKNDEYDAPSPTEMRAIDTAGKRQD